MDSLDYWRLCDELNVIHAALLIAGCDPSKEAGYAETWQMHERPEGYEAAKSALKYAILSKKLPATIRRNAWERGWDEDPADDERFSKDVHDFDDGALDADGAAVSRKIRGIIYRIEPDWEKTTVKLDALKDWLRGRGMTTGFFFPESTNDPDYLDAKNPRYAQKLAAAVCAWRAVTDTQGKSPKQALMKWLREHAARFDLSDDEGKPIEQTIDDVAKVANWQPGGGAPKTPGG